MIRAYLHKLKQATFAVHMPEPKAQGLPLPRGTGFFVSPRGLLLTARHVITKNGTPDGPLREDIGSLTLMKELRGVDKAGKPIGGEVCVGATLLHDDPVADIALLKVADGEPAQREWLKERGGEFPSVRLASALLDEGDEVFAFGYPLSSGGLLYPGPEIFVGTMTHSPRVTSAIVASAVEAAGMITESGPPLRYVLDKALNYGNSGGPIASAGSGLVHALCSSFQPVLVPQLHLRNAGGQVPSIVIPSLYGVVLNTSHPRVRVPLEQQGVQYAPQPSRLWSRLLRFLRRPFKEPIKS